jgi:hypothetical protein
MMSHVPRGRRAVLWAVWSTVAALVGCGSSGSTDAGADSASGDDGGITVISYPCPTIESLTAAPTCVAVDASVSVSVATTVPDGGMLMWSAPSGYFADASATDTTYNCGTLGTVPLTATVTFQLCKAFQHVSITCK